MSLESFSFSFSVKDLNLHGSGLSKVKLLSTLPNIKKLVLSFNELTSMAELGGSVSNSTIFARLTQ